MIGTLIFTSMIHGNVEGVNTERLNKFGKFFVKLLNMLGYILVFIVSGSLALVENIFILPAWGIYNLCYEKEYRKSYTVFLGLEKEKPKVIQSSTRGRTVEQNNTDSGENIL